MLKENTIFEPFFKFLDDSPTAYHAAQTVKKHLEKEGYLELDLKETWKLKKGGRYFVLKGGSILAFITPTKTPKDTLIFASHTDSPALKLKPQSEYIKEGLVLLGAEVYGAPLLSSWLNRDLGIAGKVLYKDKKGQIKEALVNCKNAPLVIPQLAIHLDREVNEKGLLLNKQEHLNAIAAIDPGKKESHYLTSLLLEQIDIKELLAHDLFLYPLERAAFLGKDHTLIAGYRMDSLVSVFSILKCFLEKRAIPQNTLQMMVFWDHEEIGSETATGALSPFFEEIFERISLAENLSREEHLKRLAATHAFSVDLGHSVNPNYAEKHDPQHKPKLGSGVLIKTNAQKRYATDIASCKKLLEIASMKKIPYMLMAGRNDIPSGSTIGPLHAAKTGIATVDLGIGQLSMHSTRELIAKNDMLALMSLLRAVLS